jgi:hypothetical protein
MSADIIVCLEYMKVVVPGEQTCARMPLIPVPMTAIFILPCQLPESVLAKSFVSRPFTKAWTAIQGHGSARHSADGIACPGINFEYRFNGYITPAPRPCHR